MIIICIKQELVNAESALDNKKPLEVLYDKVMLQLQEIAT